MKRLPYYTKNQSGSTQSAQGYAAMLIIRSTMCGIGCSLSHISVDPHVNMMRSVMTTNTFKRLWCSKSSH